MLCVCWFWTFCHPRRMLYQCFPLLLPSALCGKSILKVKLHNLWMRIPHQETNWDSRFISSWILIYTLYKWAITICYYLKAYLYLHHVLNFFLFLLIEMGSCILSQPQTGCVVKDDLELVTFILLPPECWNSRLVSPPTVYAVLAGDWTQGFRHIRQAPSSYIWF